MDTLEQELLLRLRALCRQRDQTEPNTPEYDRLVEAIRATRRAYEEVQQRVRRGFYLPGATE